MSRDLLKRFQELHRSGHFIIANPWDVGSARVLEAMGFEALATTSSGFAACLGKSDQSVTSDELIQHVEELTSAVSIPLSVDAEYGFSLDVSGLGAFVEQVVRAGAVGMSIEDYVPERGLLDAAEAVERVGAVVDAAEGRLVVTARAESHLYGGDDLDDTISRLQGYAEVGADVLYAPGLSDIGDFERLVRDLPKPINALLGPSWPTVSELAAVGVRRMSVGGGFAFSAYGALEEAAHELLSSGSSAYRRVTLSREVADEALSAG